MTGRGRALVWPKIHQHRLEAPPQRAGSRRAWLAGRWRPGNALSKWGKGRKIMVYLKYKCGLKICHCNLPGVKRSGLSQWCGSWWIDHMFTKTRVPRGIEWPPILQWSERERERENFEEISQCLSQTSTRPNLLLHFHLNLVKLSALNLIRSIF